MLLSLSRLLVLSLLVLRGSCAETNSIDCLSTKQPDDPECQKLAPPVGDKSRPAVRRLTDNWKEVLINAVTGEKVDILTKCKYSNYGMVCYQGTLELRIGFLSC